jgi:hypothetical protein
VSEGAALTRFRGCVRPRIYRTRPDRGGETLSELPSVRERDDAVGEVRLADEEYKLSVSWPPLR